MYSNIQLLCAGIVEEDFNRHHAKARNIIERTFGILKTRWRSIFLRALEIRPLFAPKVVAACCLLHNICVTADDVPQDEEEEEAFMEGQADENVAADVRERELSGNHVRARLAAQLAGPPELAGHDYI